MACDISKNYFSKDVSDIHKLDQSTISDTTKPISVKELRQRVNDKSLPEEKRHNAELTLQGILSRRNEQKKNKFEKKMKTESCDASHNFEEKDKIEWQFELYAKILSIVKVLVSK